MESATLESVSLWIGEIAMAFGIGAFWIMSRRAPQSERHHYLISIAIVAIATASYFAMAAGQTRLTLGDGHDLYVARYIDWAFTTPLLLLGTALIGIGSYRADATNVSAAIGADVFMILTGLAGALSTGVARYVWFVFSCLAFVAVLAILWGPLRAKARAIGRGSEFARLIAILTALWVQYPIVWLVGTEGLRILSSSAATLWYTILDVTAKVVFGFVSLAIVERFEATRVDSRR